MLDDYKITDLVNEILSCTTEHDLANVKAKTLGKDGIVAKIFSTIKSVPNDQKKSFGEQVNAIKIKIEEAITAQSANIVNQKILEGIALESVDITLPARKLNTGSISPITKTIHEIEAIFAKYGFGSRSGPEIEQDFFNFTALNIPETHPSRQMHDTFYLDKKAPDGTDYLLRTQTSSVQIRTMISEKPPFRFLSSGKTYRSDSDRTHSPMFHQIEGLCVDKGVTFAQLKWMLDTFLSEFFNTPNIKIRLRPSYFPFTEPSAEVDIDCGNGWLEVMGCGMVHQNVLTNCNIDYREFQGFAFGLGVERMAMLKYGINDLRGLYNSEPSWNVLHGFRSFDI